MAKFLLVLICSLISVVVGWSYDIRVNLEAISSFYLMTKLRPDEYYQSDVKEIYKNMTEKNKWLLEYVGEKFLEASINPRANIDGYNENDANFKSREEWEDAVTLLSNKLLNEFDISKPLVEGLEAVRCMHVIRKFQLRVMNHPYYEAAFEKIAKTKLNSTELKLYKNIDLDIYKYWSSPSRSNIWEFYDPWVNDQREQVVALAYKLERLDDYIDFQGYNRETQKANEAVAQPNTEEPETDEDLDTGLRILTSLYLLNRTGNAFAFDISKYLLSEEQTELVETIAEDFLHYYWVDRKKYENAELRSFFMPKKHDVIKLARNKIQTTFPDLYKVLSNYVQVVEQLHLIVEFVKDNSDVLNLFKDMVSQPEMEFLEELSMRFTMAQSSPRSEIWELYGVLLPHEFRFPSIIKKLALA